MLEYTIPYSIGVMDYPVRYIKVYAPTSGEAVTEARGALMLLYRRFIVQTHLMDLGGEE